MQHMADVHAGPALPGAGAKAATGNPCKHTSQCAAWSCMALPLTQSSALCAAVTDGLLAWYTAASFNPASRQWMDLSGNGHHATASGPQGSLYVVAGGDSSGLSNGQPYLHGTASSRVDFPPGVLPAVYTLFHLAKYDGPSTGRIFTTSDVVAAPNHLSGFFDGHAGCAHHWPMGWVSPMENLHGHNWVLSTDQQWVYRSQGVDRTTIARGEASSTPFPLTINGYPPYPGQAYPGQASDWGVAAVVVYRGELGAAQMAEVEDWLSQVYGVVLGRPLGGLHYGVHHAVHQCVHRCVHLCVHLKPAGTRPGLAWP